MKTLELPRKIEEEKEVLLPLLIPEEEALVAQVMSGHVYVGTLGRFLLFIQSRRDVVDTVVNKERKLFNE